MKYKKGQKVWVKGIIRDDGDVVFRDGAGSFIEYIRRVDLHRLDIHTDDKVTIPLFVADWVEKARNEDGLESLFDFSESAYDELSNRVLRWISDKANTEKMVRAYLDGYKVEQEKLYTVEIPDPNHFAYEHTFLTRGLDGTVHINRVDGEKWRTDNRNKLTEEEIKQDFAWAWEQGFAKEVKE